MDQGDIRVWLGYEVRMNRLTFGHNPDIFGIQINAQTSNMNLHVFVKLCVFVCVGISSSYMT